MPTRNTTTSSSTIRTDYGSTTFKISISNDSVNTTTDNATAGEDNDSIGTSTTTTATAVGYQSLPFTSSTNLYARSSLTSRLGKMSIDTMPNSEMRQIHQRIDYFLNVLNQVCIGFVTVWMSWMCLRSGLAGTALHAWLVTIGFSFLMAEGVMCLYNHNVLTYNYRRTTKTTIHWVLQALGGSLGIAGALIKCIQKGFSLHSTHGKLGFAALILCCISLLSGLTALYAMRLKQCLSPLLNKSFHNFLGLVTFAVALAAQYYGYTTGFFSRKTPSNDFTILMKIFTLLTLFLSSWGPLKSLMHKMRSIYKHYR
ncbi:uncharacterized protein isoform X2 [Musca autumnalis]